MSKRATPPNNYAKQVKPRPISQAVKDALSNRYSDKSDKEEQKEIEDKSSNGYQTYLIEHNQAYYSGPWKDGLPHGRGVCIYSDGSYYEGQFKQGEANDKEGFLVLPSGAFYCGSIKDSIIEGKGKMRQDIGSDNPYVYDGQWKEGKPNGKGHEQYGDGSEYEGYFKNGVKNFSYSEQALQQKKKEFYGNEVLANPKRQSLYRSKKTGQSYEGEFYNGRMHGFGKYTKKDSQGNIIVSYIGEFRNGKKHGQGVLYTKEGVLSGSFVNDVVTGEGKFEWSDNRVYVGKFKDSKFHGEGSIILPNGNVLEGTWEDGHSVELKAVKKK